MSCMRKRSNDVEFTNSIPLSACIDKGKLKLCTDVCDEGGEGFVDTRFLAKRERPIKE